LKDERWKGEGRREKKTSDRREEAVCKYLPLGMLWLAWQDV